VLNVSRSTLLVIGGLITGSSFSTDVSSFRDEVESREVDWLIDRHECLFWLGQNIHRCSFGLRFFRGEIGPVAGPGENAFSCQI
jgi:hypothetical protein